MKRKQLKRSLKKRYQIKLHFYKQISTFRLFLLVEQTSNVSLTTKSSKSWDRIPWWKTLSSSNASIFWSATSSSFTTKKLSRKCYFAKSTNSLDWIQEHQKEPNKSLWFKLNSNSRKDRLSSLMIKLIIQLLLIEL